MAGYEIVTAAALPDTPPCQMSDAEWGEVRKRALPPGFRYLVTADGQELVEPVLLYLHWKCVENAKILDVGNTQSTYCKDLYEWFSYMDAAGLRWDTVATDDIRTYREGLFRFGRATATVKKRLVVVLDFYKWARLTGLFDDVIDDRETGHVPRSHGRNMLAHIGGVMSETSRLLPKDYQQETANALSEAVVSAVLDKLGSRLGTLGDPRPSRDRVIARLAMTTGMRVHEVVALTVWQARSLVPDPCYGTSPMRITVTKGLKPRTVLVPDDVRAELLEYIDTERALALKGVKEPTEALFVNAANANRNKGGAVTAHTVERNFHKAVIAAGLTTIAIVAGPQGAERQMVARYSFHDLRHTFAVNYYWAHRRASDKEPWLTLKTLLGHADIQTTIEIYLRSVSVVESGVTDETTRYMRALRDGQTH